MMRLISHALCSWALWRQHRQARRAIPALLELDRLEANYRRQHRRGSARIIRAKREVINSALAGKRMRS